MTSFRLRDATNRFITPLFEDVKTGFGGDEMTFQGSYNYFIKEQAVLAFRLVVLISLSNPILIQDPVLDTCSGLACLIPEFLRPTFLPQFLHMMGRRPTLTRLPGIGVPGPGRQIPASSAFPRSPSLGLEAGNRAGGLE